MSLLRIRALLNITSERLDENEDDEFILYHMRFLLTTLFQEPTYEILELSLKCLTNLCSSSHRNELLSDACSSTSERSRFVSRLKTCVTSGHRQLAVGLLVNLTRTEQWLHLVVEEDPAQFLSTLFLPNQPLRHTVALILNLTTNRDIRKAICSNVVWIQRLISEFDAESDQEKAVLFAGVLKNCCFEDDYHMKLLADDYGLLESFLLRLCGPEDDVDQTDRQQLPKRVESVLGTPNAVRSTCPELILTICQAFLQLCATSAGRTRLRSCGVYFVLRELHKYEESKVGDTASQATASHDEIIYYLEQVVDQLICEERDRDTATVETSLRNVPIDSQMSEKLDRIRSECLGSRSVET